MQDVAPIVPLNVYSPSMRLQSDFLRINGAVDLVLVEDIGTLRPDLPVPQLVDPWWSPPKTVGEGLIGRHGLDGQAFEIAFVDGSTWRGLDLVVTGRGDVRAPFLVSGCLLRPRPVPAPAAIWPLAMGCLVLLRRRRRAG